MINLNGISDVTQLVIILSIILEMCQKLLFINHLWTSLDTFSTLYNIVNNRIDYNIKHQHIEDTTFFTTQFS